MPEMLKKAGIYTHLVTDHLHYFEDGGATYHNRFSTWEYFRGQEGDPWADQVIKPVIPPQVSHRVHKGYFEQNHANRARMMYEADFRSTRPLPPAWISSGATTRRIIGCCRSRRSIRTSRSLPMRNTRIFTRAISSSTTAVHSTGRRMPV
jgi:hypothetical protein